ncbi:hypothetical protein BGW36DRAFT_389357 [Talaromyces proteolyticus]|uniref:DUF2415 domain-containing protein n=1 Tax=Talaromyces proteolyticus TaxID=1131652 RepID=A0AAD4KFL2_9EURO|nr:uncharacterized protein BGW36DRAFT_389357 [Talaromyces proteolyticus]KAH8690807.1 hypothetical protein BGW36DRAFT_389357 [Talaromyces proteolyticus]
MTLDYTLPCLSTDSLLLPTKRRFFPFKIPNFHRQLRHYISTADADKIYIVAHKIVHSIHIKSQNWDTIERVPFEPKCLAAAYGWIVVGGSDNGECAFIRLPGREENYPVTESRVEETDVDTALPIELDLNSRTPPTASGESRSSFGPAHGQSDIPEIYTKTLSGSIVNSVTIHRFPGDNQRFAHEDVVVFSNNDKTVRLFSLTRTKLLETLPHPTCMNYAMISPDSKLLAAVGDENFAYFYRIQRDPNTVDYGDYNQRLSGWTWELIRRIELPLSTSLRTTSRPDDGSCFTIAFSPASHLCAIGSQGGLISVYDVQAILSAKEDAICSLYVFSSSRPDSDAGAVRSMTFSPDPWDLLVWVEDTGRAGIADVRSGFYRRQIVHLDRDDPDLETVRTTFSTPLISRSGDEELDVRPGYRQITVGAFDDDSEIVHSGLGSSRRLTPDREGMQGLTNRERQIIDLLNTARWATRDVFDGDADERPPRASSNLRHGVNTSSIGDSDTADPSPRTTPPFRSTDATLHELFREHYLGRAGSTERTLGQRRRGSIVVSQPPGPGTSSNVESADNDISDADVEVLLRLTASPMDIQSFGNSPPSTDNNNSAGNGFSSNGSGTGNRDREFFLSRATALFNPSSPFPETASTERQPSQRSRSIPRRSSRQGTTTESRYDNQRATTAELRASVAAERLRRQRVAVGETRSPRWIRHFMDNNLTERNLGYMPRDQDPGETAGVGWGHDGRSLYIGTVEGIYEFQLNVQDRKSFPVFSFR